MAGAKQGRSTRGITEYKVSVEQLVRKMQDMKEAGASSEKIYSKLGAEIESLRQKATTLGNSMKGAAERAKSSAKTTSQYDQAVANLSTRLNQINSLYGKLDATENRILKNHREELKISGKLAQEINKNAKAVKENTTSRKQALGVVGKERKEENDKLKRLLKAERALKNNAKETNKLKTANQKHVKVVSEQQKKLNQRTKELIKARRALRNNAKETDKLRIKNKKLTDSIKNSNKGIKGFSKGIGGALRTLTRFGAAGAILGTVLGALKFAFIDSFKAAAEFEKGLANLKAVGGASSDELGQLKEAALGAAGATKFTANEILQLQTELSKLGFSADDVVEATKSIAIGAQALGSGLDETAIQVGKLINQFNLLAQDSDKVVDILVTTINESALSLQSFGTAIQYVGPISRDLGVSLESTAGAMAVLADNGFTASRIGTGLRGILTELGSETVDVKARLKDLADENISLSEAVDLVGKRNAAQLITLLNNIEVLDESENKYYEQGRALEAAAEQGSTFAGQMELVKSAVNEAQIGFGDFILETGAVQRVLGFISDSAKETYEAFKLLKNQGADALTDDLAKAEKGFSTFDIALERTAKDAGVSAEKVKAAFDDDVFREVLSGVPLTGAVSSKLQDMFADTFGDGDLADTFQGYLALLNEELAKVEKDNLIKEQRNDVDDRYKLLLEEMIQQERDGIDVSEKASDQAGDINAQRQALIRSTKELQEELKNDTDLTSEQIKEKKDLILIFESQEKALGQYERRFANFVLTQKGSESIERTKARNFKEQLDIIEDLKDGIEKNTQAEILASEASGDFIDAVEKRVKGNEDLQQINNEGIRLTEVEKKSIEDKIAVQKKSLDAEGKLTKQAQANISTLEKELETLTNIKRKYEEKNEELENSTKLLEDLNKGFEKELKDLEETYKKGDISTAAFEAQKEVILGNYTDLLREIAEKSPELKKAVDALIKNANTGDGIDWKSVIADGIDEAVDVVTEALEGFSDTALENTKNRLESEKAALKERYETEDYLAKQQFENGLINEAQYRRRQAQLRKKQIAQENAIDKKIFEAEQKRDKENARVDYLTALASIVPELIKAGKVIPTDLAISSAITAGLATAAFGAEISAIGQRKFFPKKFAQGGMVEGPSHADGGVPFTVQGNSGYEMEGGEFIINKRAASLHRDLLERINGSAKPNVPAQPMKFAQGGVVNKTTTMIAKDSSESVDYLKAIAQATTQAAINSNKPVKAYVTSKDLRQDETARRIKQNNTTI